MRISVSEFRDMLEQHSQEMRQAQEDYNLMADEKEAEIRRLEKKLDATQDAMRDLKFKALEILHDILNGGAIKGTPETISAFYDNLVDGLDGY